MWRLLSIAWEERLKIMRERQREIRAMETDDKREVRLERQTEGDKRWGDCWAKRREIEDYAGELDRRTAMVTAEQRDITAKVFNIRVFPTHLYWWNFHHYSVNCGVWMLSMSSNSLFCAIFTDLHVFVMHVQLYTTSSYNHTFLCDLTLRLAPQWLSFSSN